MVFGFSFNWTLILPGDTNVTTGIYEFNLIGKELKIIISEEFLMLTNEASYSIHIPTISACFSEEARAVQLLLPELWDYLFRDGRFLERILSFQHGISFSTPAYVVQFLLLVSR